mmetsp:Transcript_21444/g.60804  ORF Transcript_21444/g.60804 Transcript_21444/m.60804 type:complete len:215 (-) Transcript_21444:297-941(-)
MRCAPASPQKVGSSSLREAPTASTCRIRGCTPRSPTRPPRASTAKARACSAASASALGLGRSGAPSASSRCGGRSRAVAPRKAPSATWTPCTATAAPAARARATAVGTGTSTGRASGRCGRTSTASRWIGCDARETSSRPGCPRRASTSRACPRSRRGASRTSWARGWCPLFCPATAPSPRRASRGRASCGKGSRTPQSGSCRWRSASTSRMCR